MVFLCFLMGLIHITMGVGFNIDGDNTGAALQLTGAILWFIMGMIREKING